MRIERGIQLFVLLVCLFFAPVGCGGAAGPEAGEVEKRADLIFTTGGYIPQATGAVRHLTAGGLFGMGDIDSDGYSDIAVASALYPGYLAVYSGKNGQEIWRFSALVGKAARAAGEAGYSIESFLVVDDLSGDGVPDIFLQDDWGRKKVFLISGADGSVITRGDAGRIAPAITTRELTGDGRADIVCFYSFRLGVMILSGADLSVARQEEEILDLEEDATHGEWIWGDYPDEDGDGIDEMLAGFDTPEDQVIIVVSGKDFSEIRRFSIEWDPVRAKRTYACPGDLNRDGKADLVKASAAGGGEEGHESYLAAYSGADGSRIWRIEGTEIPSGVRRFTIDAKTGERTERPGDIGFGSTCVSLPDIDGDGAGEVAVVLSPILGERPQRSILVFSGATGERIATLYHGRDDFAMLESRMAVVESADGRGTPGIAVPGKTGKKDYGVAVFAVEPIRRQRGEGRLTPYP